MSLLAIDPQVIIAWWDKVFGDSAAWLLIFAGLMALVWFFYEGIRRGWVKPKNEAWERDTVSKLLKVIIILGVVLGVILIITAIMTMIMHIPPSYKYRDNPGVFSRGDNFDYLVSISLLIMGLAMFIKPLEDVPLATIIGLACGAGVAIVLAMIIPANIVSDKTLKWVLIVVFVVVTSLIGAMIRVWIAGIEGVAKFFSWPPIALILAAYCLVEGFSVLLAGKTLFLIGS